MREKQDKLAPYVQALPGILQYQVFTKILLGLWLFLMGRVFRLLLNSTGRVAVSSGDFVFLFTRWQGILIVLCAFVSLYVYVALDLNAKVLLSRELLSGERIFVWDILRRALPTSLEGHAHRPRTRPRQPGRDLGGPNLSTSVAVIS